MRNSLEKVFVVLDVIASGDGPVSLKSIAGTTGYDPSTISRILSNLVEIGYVRKVSYREFALDLGLIPLGQKALSHFALPQVANPVILKATLKLGVEGALAGVHRGKMVYLYRSRIQGDAVPLIEDYRYPLHRSNCGLVILAGGDDAETRQLLTKSLRESGVPRAGMKTRLSSLMGKIGKIRKDGYSYLVEKRAWNIAFPVSCGGRVFSVSLHQSGKLGNKQEKMILECALLARRIEEVARGHHTVET